MSDYSYYSQTSPGGANHYRQPSNDPFTSSPLTPNFHPQSAGFPAHPAYTAVPLAYEAPEMVDLSSSGRADGLWTPQNHSFQQAMDGPSARNSAGGTADDDGDFWEEGETPWYKKKKVIVAGVGGLILALALSLGVGLGVGLGAKKSNASKANDRLTSIGLVTTTSGNSVIVFTITSVGSVTSTLGVSTASSTSSEDETQTTAPSLSTISSTSSPSIASSTIAPSTTSSSAFQSSSSSDSTSSSSVTTESSSSSSSVVDSTTSASSTTQASSSSSASQPSSTSTTSSLISQCESCASRTDPLLHFHHLSYHNDRLRAKLIRISRGR